MRRFHTKISSITAMGAMKLVDTILPPRCIVTGEIVDKQGMVASSAWSELGFISAPQCICCGIPFDYALEEGANCTQCLDYPPKFKSARAALKYDDASRKMILGFKHGDKTYAVKAFVPWLKKAGADMMQEADYFIPVPLHPYRLLSRRYNQAALMAFALSKETNVSCLPMGLQRIRATPPQGHKTIAERRKNVKKAFSVPKSVVPRLKGKKIILVDDVFTTGATVNECTRALLSAGAAEVHVLTLARVVKDEFL